MMLNPFKLRRYAAFILLGFLPAFGYMVGTMFYNNLWLGIGLTMVCYLVGAITAGVIIKNPFTAMLEGSGLLVLDISSPGMIKPFLVALKGNYIKGKTGRQPIRDVFDRETVHSMTPPKWSSDKLAFIKTGVEKKENGLQFTLSEEDYNASRFALFHWPTLIYNGQTNSLITKDWLSTQESASFANHTILFLNRQVEELTSVVRDFARYVVEMTKPRGSWLENKWLWIVVVIILIVAGIIFIPRILTVASDAGSAGGLSGIIGPMTPRG